MKKLSLGCLALALGVFSVPAVSAEVLTLTIESPVDSAFERFSTRRNTAAQTRVGKRSLNLARASRSVVAFQLPVAGAIVPDSILHSRVTLPLVRPLRRSRLVDLSFTGLEPNVGPFQAQRGDISRRSELAPAETLQVFIEAGASEIVIGDILLSTAKASLQHPNWVVGGDGNAVAFKLRRTDIGKRIPRIAGLGRRWSTAVPMLELCRGESCRLHLACLGDSNTQSDYMTAFGVVSWCELLSGRRFAPTLATYNYAVPGGTLVSSKMVDANDQFDAMISVGDLPDVAVAAFGSNDIIFFGVSPTKLVDAYLALRLRAEQLGIRLLVGLTPYLYGERAVHNATIVELNALIAATFPPEEIADFFIVDHNCFFDDVHMNNLGQQVRCDAVLEALF